METVMTSPLARFHDHEPFILACRALYHACLTAMTFLYACSTVALMNRLASASANFRSRHRCAWFRSGTAYPCDPTNCPSRVLISHMLIHRYERVRMTMTTTLATI